MEIKINSLEQIHEAAKQFIAEMGDNTVFAFYGNYRIKKLEEVYDMGYEDYFYSGALCFIEWPELIEDVLPGNTVNVYIEEAEDGTRVVRF